MKKGIQRVWEAISHSCSIYLRLARCILDTGTPSIVLPGQVPTKTEKKHMTNPSRIEEHDDWMDLLWIELWIELWIDMTSAVSLSIITIVISDFMTKLFVFFNMTKEDSAGGSKMADFENHRHLQLTISIGIGWYLESLDGIFQWLFHENPFEFNLRALSSYTSNG